MREKIEKSKSKRLLQSKLEESTLADTAGADEDLVSAAEWVRRSRHKAELSEKERQRLAAEEAARRLDEEDELVSAAPVYSTADLKGLRVLHGANDFEMGDSVILTLADSSVLTRDENGKIIGVNDEMDVLENINITEDYKRRQREERRKKASRGAYSGYDDDEFAEGVAPKTKRSILGQYDKEKEDGPRMVLSENGVNLIGQNQGGYALAETVDRVEHNLDLETKALSDYLTPAEFSKFNKPKKEKKMRKIRKKGKEEDPYAELLSSTTDTGADRGSRSAASGLGLSVSLAQEEALRREAYNEAVRLDAAKTAQLQKNRFVDEDDDDDMQISAALARARQIALKNRHCDADEVEKKVSMLSKSDAVSIAIKNAVGSSDQSIIDSHRLPRVEAESKEEMDGLDVDVDGRDASGKLYFTDTTEFTSRLQARLYERDRDKADAAFKDQANKKRHRERELEEESADLESRKQHRMDTEDVRMDLDDEDESDSDGDAELMEDSDQLFGHQNPVVAKGLAATLALLKGTGDLHTKEELAGRTKDSRDYDPSAPVAEGDDRIKLEYRDKFGRKLTQKEAFRQLSYKFHGIEPSRKKKEKTLKV